MEHTVDSLHEPAGGPPKITNMGEVEITLLWPLTSPTLLPLSVVGRSRHLFPRLQAPHSSEPGTGSAFSLGCDYLAAGDGELDPLVITQGFCWDVLALVISCEGG